MIESTIPNQDKAYKQLLLKESIHVLALLPAYGPQDPCQSDRQHEGTSWKSRPNSMVLARKAAGQADTVLRRDWLDSYRQTSALCMRSASEPVCVCIFSF